MCILWSLLGHLFESFQLQNERKWYWVWPSTLCFQHQKQHILPRNITASRIKSSPSFTFALSSCWTSPLLGRMLPDYKSSNDTALLSFCQLLSTKSLPKHRVSIWRSNIVHNSWFFTNVLFQFMKLAEYWAATNINFDKCYILIFGDFQHLTFAFRPRRNPCLAQVVFLFRYLIYWRLYRAVGRREKRCWTWRDRFFALLALLTFTWFTYSNWTACCSALLDSSASFRFSWWPIHSFPFVLLILFYRCCEPNFSSPARIALQYENPQACLRLRWCQNMDNKHVFAA